MIVQNPQIARLSRGERRGLRREGADHRRSGVGKDLIARHHENTNRRAQAFVAVSCAGLTESLLG
jgi:transcriptional regulator of acetoin/glycerol metabolism